MTSFDAVAESYDGTFTASRIGRAQRDVVWRYLERHVLGPAPMAILELGCGTGEDAVRFAALGHQVHAVDSSAAMLRVGGAKAHVAGVAQQIHFEQVDLLEPDRLFAGPPAFDLVFSNFGPLNCLAPEQLDHLSAVLGQQVRPGGRVVLVVMPRGCPWEWLWFGLQLRPAQALRRFKRGPVVADLGASSVATWYHSPARVRQALGAGWYLRRTVAVGFAVPPSYLEPLFAKRPRTLALLVAIDRLLAGLPFVAGRADHFLIDCERCADSGAGAGGGA